MDELAPLRDELAEHVSRRLRELAHAPVQEKAHVQEEPVQPEEPTEPKAPVEEAEQFAVEITDLSDIEPYLSEDMVTRKAMTIDSFMPGARQAAQQPPPQSQGQAPSPPPPLQIGRVQKRQKFSEQTSTGSGDTAARTPPQPSGGIIIQEPQIQAGRSVAQSSQAEQAWKPKFLLDIKPLPASACVWV